MGNVWAPMVVESDPRSDGGLCLRPGLPGVQVDAFVFQGPPQALDEDVVDAASFAVHRDAGAAALQPISPGEGRELAALIGIHDPRRAEAVDRLALLWAESAQIGAKSRISIFLADAVEGAALSGRSGANNAATPQSRIFPTVW